MTASDPGEDESEHGPVRRCIASGERLAPEQMLRFVVGPEDRLVPDLTGKLPGRGIWVRARREELERAVAKRLFSRAARREVSVAPDLPAQLDRLIERQCLDLFGLARKSGLAVTGFDEVDATLRRRRAGALIEASDGAPGGRAKLRQLVGDAPVVALFSASALAEAFGRDGVVVHAVIAPGKLADRLIAASNRLAGLRGLV